LFLPENTENNTKEEHYYSEIILCRDDTIKVDSNQLYELYTGQGSSVGKEFNLSYGEKKPHRGITENQYDYAQTTDLPLHQDRENYVHMESNPSYGVVTKMATNTTPDSNPAHSRVKAKK